MTKSTLLSSIVCCLLLLLGLAACQEETYFADVPHLEQHRAVMNENDPAFNELGFCGLSNVLIDDAIAVLGVETALDQTKVLNEAALAPLVKLNNYLYQAMRKHPQAAGGEMAVFVHIHDGQQYWKIAQTTTDKELSITQSNQIPQHIALSKEAAFMRGLSPNSQWLKQGSGQQRSTNSHTFDDFKYPVQVDICRAL